MNTLQAPFPFFGGKRRAAGIIWRALGDPGGFVEPFAGSAAVLLARPPFSGRRVETINDADGWLVNTWRAIQLSPDEVAQHAAGPVSEVDYHARLAWLQERRTPDLVSWLEGHPEAHDAKAAGWWLYVAACGIGDPWGGGPWRVIDGHLRNSRATLGKVGTDTLPSVAESMGANRELPHLGDAGQGVHRKLPHLGNAGRGVHRKLPHLGNAGRGVHRGLPHLGNAGQGVHSQQLAYYMRELSHRLERVRITCGSWERVLQNSPIRAKSGGDGSIAVLLDPPYATSGDLYAGTTDASVAKDVAEWCAEASSDLRVVLCGYDDEHSPLEAHGWERVEGRAGGGRGYSKRGDNGRRERLWLSPGCLNAGIQDVLDFGEGA